MPNTATKQRLLTPGPTQVPEAVLRELAQPVIHHRTAEFRAVFAEVSDRLKRVFLTEQPVLTISGSGTTAFEAALICLVKPGSTAITVAGGKFGERWQDVYDIYADSFGIHHVKINVPWGETVEPGRIEQALRDHSNVSVVVAVHSETSTATVCDLATIARVVRRSALDVLLIVDGITAVGAMPVEMDAWDIDVLVTGSQKALMIPPGLAYVALGERALKRLERVPPKGYYNLDLRRWLASWRHNDVPFTPPVNLIRAQRVALEMIESEGIRNVWARTANLAAATRATFEAMQLKPISSRPSDSVSGAYYPEGLEDAKFRGALRDKHGIHIAGGQDGRGARWKGKIFRISHMGFVNADDTQATLNAIERELCSAGVDITEGTAKRTAKAALADQCESGG